LSTLAACGQAAHAQSVTVYGILDLAVERLGDVGPAGASLTRVPGLTGSVPSRLGLRGAEDLGGGLKAVFTLEMGLGADTGALNQGGRAWGRQTYVGLAGPWGAITAGRQYTMLFWSIAEADILGPNLYSSGSLDSYLPNARYDNALAYRGRFSGLTIGLAYTAGRDGVNAGPSPAGTNCAGENAADRRACTGRSYMLKYDTPSWGVALASDSFHGGAGAYAGLVTSALTDTRTIVNGYLRVGDLKLGAGHMTRDNDGSATAPRSALTFVGASWALTPQVALEGELFELKFKNSPRKATLAAMRASYAISHRSTVYATLGRIDNRGALAISVSGAQAGGAPAAGASQSGLAAGIRQVF